MKALSLKQPYASLIADGKKIYETRKWTTKYRGDFLIVVSQKPKDYFSRKAIAVATLINCRQMTKEDEEKACTALYNRAHVWELNNIRRIKPFAIKGQLGLFEIELSQPIEVLETTYNSLSSKIVENIEQDGSPTKW